MYCTIFLILAMLGALIKPTHCKILPQMHTKSLSTVCASKSSQISNSSADSCSGQEGYGILSR